jgi:type IV secretory pathway TrbF-like protein
MIADETVRTGTHQAQAEETPYRIARTLELSIAAGIRREAASWRRATFVSIGLNALAVLAVLITATRTQHDVLVYRDDGRGLHMMSEAIDTRTPTRIQIEAQIAHWLRALRDVPGGGDYAAVDRDIHDVLAGTQANSHALQSLRTFYTDQNPKVLSATMSRTVHDVAVTSYTANTYAVQWAETLRFGSRTNNHAYSGSVTIAPARIPDDPALGLLNPAGVYITDYDLPWSNP